MQLHRNTRHHATSATLAVILARYIQVANAQNYDYTGGVALRYPNDTCPFNTDYIGTSFYPNCCPVWTVGSPTGSGYCCSSKQDCYVTVASAPKCADPSWSYCYDPESDAKIGFCCLQGWHCEVEKDSSGNSLGVGCNAPNRVLASTQSAAITSLTAYEIPGSTSTSTASTTSSKSTNTATTPPASSQTTANADSNTGLSTGAKAGIGVGAAVGGLALIGLIAWLVLFCLKRRDRVTSSVGDQQGQSMQSTQDYGYGYAKVAPGSVGEMSSVHHDPRELDSAHLSELEGSHAGHEMGNTRKWRSHQR